MSDVSVYVLTPISTISREILDRDEDATYQTSIIFKSQFVLLTSKRTFPLLTEM